MHALVIEDDPIIAMAIEDELHDLGFASVCVASSEHEAIEAVAERCPDPITSDGSLTSGTGVAAVRRIRTSLTVPVIFITGDATRARRALPGTPVLEKPFSVAQLIAAVEQVRPQTRLRR